MLVLTASHDTAPAKLEAILGMAGSARHQHLNLPPGKSGRANIEAHGGAGIRALSLLKRLWHSSTRMRFDVGEVQASSGKAKDSAGSM